MTTFGNAAPQTSSLPGSWYETIEGVHTLIQVTEGQVRGTYFGDVPWGHPFHEALKKRSEDILRPDGPMYESEVFGSIAGAV